MFNYYLCNLYQNHGVIQTWTNNFALDQSVEQMYYVKSVRHAHKCIHTHTHTHWHIGFNLAIQIACRGCKSLQHLLCIRIWNYKIKSLKPNLKSFADLFILKYLCFYLCNGNNIYIYILLLVRISILHTHTHTHIYIYVCVCVCVCKMGILTSCSAISTTVWLHYLDFHKALEEKRF